MKKFLLVLVLCVSIIGLIPAGFSCQSSPQKFEWKMATSWTEDSLFYSRASRAICDRIKVMSGNRLVITPYPAGYAAGSPAGALDVMKAVSSGEVEIGHSWSGYWMDTNRSFELFTSIPDQMVPQEWVIWLYGPSQGINLWRELYSAYNIVPFPGGLVGPEFGFFTTRPVLSLDDFKGLKLRVTGLAADVVKELGASAILTAPGDIIEALQKGEIDGFEFSVPSVDWPMGFHNIASYVSLPSWHQPSAMFETIVNKTAFDSLPSDLQAILESACKEISIIDFMTGLESENTACLHKFIEAGIQINTLDQASIRRINEITDRLTAEYAAPFTPGFSIRKRISSLNTANGKAGRISNFSLHRARKGNPQISWCRMENDTDPGNSIKSCTGKETRNE